MPIYYTMKGSENDKVLIGAMDEMTAFRLSQSKSIWVIDQSNRISNITIDSVVINNGVSPWGDRPVKVNCYLKKKKGWVMKISLI